MQVGCHHPERPGSVPENEQSFRPREQGDRLGEMRLGEAQPGA